MKKRVLLALTTVAFMLACGAAFAEESPDIRKHEGTRRHDGLWDDGARRHMGGSGMMRGGAAMRIIFALMDNDGDGTVSLQEFQAAHGRILSGLCLVIATWKTA